MPTRKKPSSPEKNPSPAIVRLGKGRFQSLQAAADKNKEVETEKAKRRTRDLKRARKQAEEKARQRKNPSKFTQLKESLAKEILKKKTVKKVSKAQLKRLRAIADLDAAQAALAKLNKLPVRGQQRMPEERVQACSHYLSVEIELNETVTASDVGKAFLRLGREFRDHGIEGRISKPVVTIRDDGMQPSGNVLNESSDRIGTWQVCTK